MEEQLHQNQVQSNSNIGQEFMGENEHLSKKVNRFSVQNCINQRVFGKDIKNMMNDNQTQTIFQKSKTVHVMEIEVSSSNLDDPSQSQVSTTSNSQSQFTNNQILSSSQLNQIPQQQQFQNSQLQQSIQQSNTNIIFNYHPFTPDKKQFSTNPVSHYSQEIFNFLQLNENHYVAQEGFIQKVQTDINEKMRAILVDWLVDVHAKFKLLPETLFMCINLIDRYLSVQAIPRTKLQLVGVSSLFIACKYEEIYAPDIKDFVYVCDQAYTKEEIFEMESFILLNLDFELTQSSSYRFFQRFQQLLEQPDAKLEFLSQYLLELTLLDARMLKYPQSLIAASSIYLSSIILYQNQNSWNKYLEKQTKYTPSQLKFCSHDLFTLMFKSEHVNPKEKHALTAIKRKFSAPKFLEVSKIQLPVNNVNQPQQQNNNQNVNNN